MSHRLLNITCYFEVALCLLALSTVSFAQSSDAARRGRIVVTPLAVTTQGPFWPPSEITDKDGNFIVIGSILTQVAPNRIVPIPGAALVSKNTVPSLVNGREDFSNPFGAPYEVIRPLDLSRGSPDRDLVLYATSFGPPEGDFGGGLRIPQEGQSQYNLNGAPFVCPEIFPSSAQRSSYRRDNFPLNEVPISGFRGDDLAYDVNTGAPFTPNLGSGTACFPDGCPGEDPLDFRRTRPITLNDWMRASGDVKIKLTRYDVFVNAFTHAKFIVTVRHLLPNSVYTIWAVRLSNFAGSLPDPLFEPNVFVTDRFGNAQREAEVRNPFPDPQGSDAGSRIVGIAIAFHSDFQNWGACTGKFGAGGDSHGALNTFAAGTQDITKFVTKEPGQ